MSILFLILVVTNHVILCRLLVNIYFIFYHIIQDNVILYGIQYLILIMVFRNHVILCGYLASIEFIFILVV